MVFEKLNKTCCNLVSFGSCFIVHSVGMGLFLFIGGPTLICRWVNFPIAMATHPHTNEGMGHIPWYKLLFLSKNQILKCRYLSVNYQNGVFFLSKLDNDHVPESQYAQHGWLNQTKQVKNTKL